MDIKTTVKEFAQKDYLSKLSEDERGLLRIEISLLLVDFEIELKRKQIENFDKLILTIK